MPPPDRRSSPPHRRTGGKPAYGCAYSARIPGARFEIIEAAGHHPEIEQPGAFVERVMAFVSS